MALPVTLNPTSTRAVIASGDVADFWTDMAGIITFPSGFTSTDVKSISISLNGDGTITINVGF